MLLLLGYRSPSCTSTTFAEFTDFLHSLCDEWSGHILILRDFNFPTIDWSNMSHRRNISTISSSLFIDFATSLNLKQLESQPTRGLNILDILLVSQPTIIEAVHVLSPFTTSNHNSISFRIRETKQQLMGPN